MYACYSLALIFPLFYYIKFLVHFFFLQEQNDNRKRGSFSSRPTPLPDLIEENEIEINIPEPQSNQPILMAAHDLHLNVNQWSSSDNDLIAVAKRITLLMAQLSELVRSDNNKKDLIATAKQLADESQEITRLSKLIANDCTDKRMKTVK